MPASDLLLRPATEHDLTDILTLFRETIESLDTADYDSQQRKAWASSAQDAERWRTRLQEQYFLVAELDGKIVGFASLAHASMVDLLYVHKDHQRQGIAQRLLERIRACAMQSNSTAMHTYASRTAEAFFIANGFRKIRDNEVQRAGALLTNALMIKPLRGAVVLQTERLTLEEATLEDGAFFLKLLNSPNWLTFIGDRGIRSLSDAERYIEEALIASYRAHGFGLYKMVLTVSQQPVGICGLLQRDYLEHPDIGFAILPNHEGQGLTQEAAQAVLQHAETRFSDLHAITTEKNARSRSLLTRLGFSLAGQKDTDGETLWIYTKHLS